MPSSTRAADEVVSPTEATRRRIAKDPLSVQCCCCQAALVVKIVSIITFLLGGVLGVGGVFLNQQTANWELQTVDLLGWLCMFTGGFLVATSLLGLSAARSGSWLFLFAYFMMLLLLLASMLLACVYAYYENARLRQYITANWTAIQARLGFGEWIGGDDGEFTLDDAIEMVRTYLLVLGGTAAAITAMLLTAFLATMRMLGVRAITVCLLLCLGLLGGGEAGVAYETLDRVPRATTYLLFGCAGVQVAAALSGACGIKMLNRECICTAMLILALAGAACAWIAASTYLWLRDTTPREPEHLLLVFGISAVADFFLVVTLLFVLCLYRSLRRDITASEKSNEMREEYSDYDQRERDAALGKRKVRKGKPREYLPNEFL